MKDHDPDFIAKLKTLNFHVPKPKAPAPKLPPAPKCADCGQPMKLVAAGVIHIKRRKKPTDHNEQSFAA